MPRREQVPAPMTAAGGTPVPADILAALMQETANSVLTPQRFPRIKATTGGAGVFTIGTLEQAPHSFEAVILASHASHSLWAPTSEDSTATESAPPLCTARDGRYGTPQPGFEHAYLHAPATGAEQIECVRCPYAQWESIRLMRPGSTSRAKACTFNRVVYLMTPWFETPAELILPPTNLISFDEYQTNCLQARMPVQLVKTRFTCEIQIRGEKRWGISTFANVGPLNESEMARMIQMREQYATLMHGTTPPAQAVQQPFSEVPDALNATDDDLPF